MTIPISAEARQLLGRLADEARRSQCADDLLVFLYFLRDNAVIVDSSGSFLKAKSFHVLGSIIHELEARPEKALEDADQRSLLSALLSDLSSGLLKVKETMRPMRES